MTQEQKTKIGEHFDELHTIVSDYGLNVPNDIRDALRAAYLAGADKPHKLSANGRKTVKIPSDSKMGFKLIGADKLNCTFARKFEA